MSDTTTESSTNVSQLCEPVPAPSRRYTTAKRMQLTYHGENDYSTSTLMLEGYDWTATDKGPLEDIMVSPRFTTLLQGHRESIRHLQLIHYNFGSLDNLARLIASLPSLTTLYLEGCSLGHTSTEQVSGHDHSKLPAIPLSLRSLGVKVEAIYKPHLVFDTLALATWFSMTSTDRHSYEVDLNMPFPLMSNQFEYRQVIAQILSEFGSNLTKVNFEITQYLISSTLRSQYEFPCPYPDFSKNRNLRQLNLNVSSSYEPSRMILTSILHTVNQSTLRQLGLLYKHWTSQGLWLELLEPDEGVFKWLSSSDAFTTLSSVELYLGPSYDESYLSRARMWEIIRKQARALHDIKGCDVRCGLDSERKENFLGLPLAYLYFIYEDYIGSAGRVEEVIRTGKAAGSLLHFLKCCVLGNVHIPS